MEAIIIPEKPLTEWKPIEIKKLFRSFGLADYFDQYEEDEGDFKNDSESDFKTKMQKLGAPMDRVNSLWDMVLPAKKKSILQKLKEVTGGFDADICFVIDFTGSMQPWIDKVRDKIIDIVCAIKQEIIGPRIAVVGYRDIGEKAVTEVLDFKEHEDIVKAWLSKRKAEGGGDAPEDYCSAFDEAQKLKWREHAIKESYSICLWKD